MKCKDCKYSVVSEDCYSDMLDCEHELLVATYHLNDKDITEKGLLAENDEGWGFKVGKEFGCIHFEARDDS